MNNHIHTYEPLTSENAALVLVDHQVGLGRCLGNVPARLSVRSGCCACFKQASFSRTTRPLMVEILKDNARPEAGEVYGATDMPWAKLVGQIAQAYGK